MHKLGNIYIYIYQGFYSIREVKLGSGAILKVKNNGYEMSDKVASYSVTFFSPFSLIVLYHELRLML